MRRGREVSEAKVILVPLFDNRADIICKRSPCEYWHPPECQFSKNGPGCQAGDKCLFPHHKVNKSDHSQKRREGDDKYPMSFVKIVGCVSEDSELLDPQRGRQARGKPMQKVLGSDSKSTVHSVYATSSKYPGKERAFAWKNASQNSSSAQFLEYEI